MNRSIILSSLTLAVAVLSAGAAFAAEPVSTSPAPVRGAVGNWELSQALNAPVGGSDNTPFSAPVATREQVLGDFAQARSHGELRADGESELTLSERFPSRYPARPAVEGKTREQVRAELAEALRTGDIVAGGEIGTKLNEFFPARYPLKARAQQRATTSNHAAL